MLEQTQRPSPPLLFLYYGNQKPVVTNQNKSLTSVEQVARQFFNIPPDTRLKFSVRFADRGLVHVDPAAWSRIYGVISSLWIEIDKTPSPVEIFVQIMTTKTITIYVHTGASVDALKALIQDSEGIPTHVQQLTHNNKTIEGSQTLESIGVHQGSRIYLATPGTLLKGQKPVIYLFPPTPISVNVGLSLSSAWEFSAVYPLVPVKRPASGQTISWNVFAEPSGKLRLSDGLEVSYLYWEAETRISREIATPPISRPHTPELEPFDPSKPVLTPQNSVLLRAPVDLTGYLDKALSAMGLHTEARTSFITYWLPSFIKYEYVALRFLEQSSYESAARLDITPKPDVVTRVFMLFRGVDACDLDIWSEAEQRTKDMDVGGWRTIVGIDVEGMGCEELFRVLEWGGMEV
ncbi:hypothetical protein F5887DRAFT_935658 [Amanita rubescens]|nr:hypothetical protein F5887DRAFT_935658 [Amanita rubescens]